MSGSKPEGFIHVSDITLNIQHDFGNTVDRVIFKTKTRTLKEVPVTISPGNQHEELFDPVLEFSVQDKLSISMQCSGRRWGIHTHPSRTIVVKLSEVNHETQHIQHGRRSYSRLFKDVEIIIGISSPSNALRASHAVFTPSSQLTAPPVALESSSEPDLPPSVHSAIFESSRDAPASGESLHLGAPSSSIISDILNICPRFRLLVVGNAGVGKSTLIRRVFGVEDVNVSNDKRGQADIDREFVAKENGLFVVHDSLGLEAGDGDNIDTVKRFIRERRAKPDIKDRLHAVWVCLPVPYAKGRLLETGMEDFLRHRKEILGDIPIVVVLTKVDLLDKQLLFDFSRKGGVKNLEDAMTRAESEKPKFLNTYCTKPLRAIASDVRHVAVSAEGGLESTIPQLVKTTTSEIERYIMHKTRSHTMLEELWKLECNAPLYLAGMAQRASIEANVDLTIGLGKKRYWKDLGSSITFSKAQVEEYMHVIHVDLIRVWNFNDPQDILRGDKFKADLLNISNLAIDDARSQKGTSDSEDDVIHTLAEIIGVLIKVPLVLPKGAAKVAKLLADVYKSSQFRVKCFMTYITDFVYVMKILFVLSPQGTITSENVDLAVRVYETSPYRNLLHFEIRDFSATYRILPGRDSVMEKIEEMIMRYKITDDGVKRLRSKIAAKAA